MASVREPRPLVRSAGWACAATLYAGVVLATLSAAPTIWFAILPHLEPHPTRWFVAAGGLVTAGLVAWSWSAGPLRRREGLGALLLVLAGYVLLLFGLYAGVAPAKKFHLLQYGVLAGIVFQAVNVDETRPGGVLLGVAFLFLVGTADEVAQGFLPTRTFRWMDMFGNYVGSTLGALAWAASSPRSPWRRGPAGEAA
jgi:hypothetical protein